MEHVNGWCFRGIYNGGLWENDLHVSAHFRSSILAGSVFKDIFSAALCRIIFVFESPHCVSFKHRPFSIYLNMFYPMTTPVIVTIFVFVHCVSFGQFI